MSMDPASQMAIGRVSRMRGDGTMELTPQAAGPGSNKLTPVEEANVNTFR